MISFPNAKINLGLNIVGKRPDGYHDIETVFYPIPLKEAVEVTPAKEFSFTSTGIPVDGPAERNLVVKAYTLLRETYGIGPVAIHLLKHIPFGAGLGGGSADAAFTLKLLNDFFQLQLPTARLEELATRLGADCPFFIQDKPVFATGIGNIFEPIELDLSAYYLCLVKPDIAVSTAEAYAQVKPHAPSLSVKEWVKRPVERWREGLENDFETSVFPQHPPIQAIKEKLYDRGALYASMSGSGSSVFGLFSEPTDFQKRSLFPDCFVWEEKLEG